MSQPPAIMPEVPKAMRAAWELRPYKGLNTIAKGFQYLGLLFFLGGFVVLLAAVFLPEYRIQGSGALGLVVAAIVIAASLGGTGLVFELLINVAKDVQRSTETAERTAAAIERIANRQRQ